MADVAAYRVRVLESLFGDDSAPKFNVAWVDDTKIAIRPCDGGESKQVIVNLHKTHANNLRGKLDLPSVDQQLDRLVEKLVVKEAGESGKEKDALIALVSGQAQTDYEASVSHNRVGQVVLDLIMKGRLVPEDGVLKASQ